MKLFAPATTLSILLVSAGIFLLSACSSIPPLAGKDEKALVCPQCEMVTVTTDHFPNLVGANYRASGPGTVGDRHTDSKDTCPGCQGVIKTFLKEGKLKHACSICEDSPFTCPVSHSVKL